MSKKSAPSTPTRSSKRDHKKVSIFQVETGTPKSHGLAKTPMRRADNFKKVVGHRVHDEHYVEYEVELNDGSKMRATDYDFKKNPGILAEYKTNVTQQTDNSDGGKTWSDLQLKCDLFAEYIVEKVLAHRVVNGKPLYLVQWRGYPNPVWNSELWESDLNKGSLQNCKNLLAAYNSQSKEPVVSGQSMRTPTKPASKSTKKRSHSPSDDEEEHVERTKSTPKKTAKKMNLNSAQSSSARVQRTITAEEQEDDEEEEGPADEPAETGPVRRVAEIQEEVDQDEDEDDGKEEERVVSDDSQEGEQKGWFSRWSFGKWF
ncbi:hypothetical protein CRE_12521 [Caenorhabditis remanei]|uniref:Chromo domain-containing protein n=2 Tax=Caenorhabditis remanei TaxID=31234 RepID=E3M7F6_CAERE|nr:hypothetical protein CRE_12521 [Caenorhabditis remanei]